MSITTSQVNILLGVGMGLGLLLILGVFGAMRKGPKISAPASQWNDADGIDLEDRLRKITLSALKPTEELAVTAGTNNRVDVVGAQAERPGTGRIPQSLPSPATQRIDLPPSTDRPVRGGTSSLRPAQTSSPQVAPTARLALPNSGSVRPPERPTSGSSNAGEGLNPLAARFSSSSIGNAQSPFNALPPTQNAGRPELPGKVASGFTSTDQNGFSHIDPSNTGKEADRQGLAAEQVGPLTELPSIEMPARHSTIGLPKLDDSGTITFPSLNRPTSPKPDAPDLAASGTSGISRGEIQPPSASLDIRAILRGEGTPAPSAPQAATPLSAFVPEQPAPRKPTFVTGPLSAAVTQGTPLGAIPFDPNLLTVREPFPVSRTIEPPTPIRPANGFDFNGPASYDDMGGERVSMQGRLNDLDITRIVDDFDLPDTGFETHVFSTAELVEVETVDGFPSFMVPSQPTNALGAPFGKAGSLSDPQEVSPPTQMRTFDAPIGQPAARPVVLSPLQEDQARQQINELAGLADVVFVKLLGNDGSVILSAGSETGDFEADARMAAMLTISSTEVEQLEFGACSAVSIEAAQSALLLAPVSGTTCLAILLSNPSRLGLLRRRIRKPITSLRASMPESSVS